MVDAGLAWVRGRRKTILTKEHRAARATWEILVLGKLADAMR